MSKSKYPNKIDSSLELPIVRDNVTQISADLFNSLRSAIIQIQKTLGILPNGDESIDVSTRLSSSLDELGNIKKSAISALNLLQGPIKNEDVADGAEIQESKINLDYSTKNLYGQVASVRKDLENIIKVVNDFILRLSIHLNTDSINQHAADQVFVEETNSLPSGFATVELTQKSLQDVLDDIYDNHINLDTANITATNRSHTASQIYFNNTGLVLSSTNVQDAIKEVSGDFGESLKNQFDLLNSNGIFKFGKISNPYISEDYEIAVSSAICSYSLDNSQFTTLFYQNNQNVLIDIVEFDIIELSNESLNYIEYFKIKSVSTDSSSNIASVTIYGSPRKNDNGSFFIRVLKNNYKFFNNAGLSTLARSSFSSSFEPSLVCQHPNAATIISKRCMPNLVNSSAKNITIENENGSYTIDVFDNSILEQTIESILFKINNYCVQNNLPILASKIVQENFSEISLSHGVPNIAADSKKRFLKIKTSTDDASTVLGFSTYIDKEIVGYGRNSVLNNGEVIESPIETIVLTGSQIVQNIGTNTISGSSINFLELGIKKGDLIFLDTAEAADTGFFSIFDVSSSSITFDNSSFSFSTSSSVSNQYFIIKSGTNLSDLSPEFVSGLNIFILTDLILESNQVISKKRVEYDISNSNVGFNIIVTNVSKGYLVNGETSGIEISTSKLLTFTDIYGVSNTEQLTGDGPVRLFSSDGLSFIDIFVFGFSTSLISTVSLNLYGFLETPQNEFLLSRSVYSYNLGFVLGYGSGYGIPQILDKRTFGTVAAKNISTTFFEKIIEGPRHELRSSGFIKGCALSNFSTTGSNVTFDISSGVHYVNGTRKEFFGALGYSYTRLTSKPLWIIFDKHGHVDFIEAEPPNLFDTSDKNIIGVYDGSSFSDLRIFINQIDRKVSNRIIVAKNIQDGHFDDIQNALNYIKKIRLFNQKDFELALSGDFEISEPITVEGGLKIFSVGKSSLLTSNITGQTSLTQNFGIDSSTSCLFFVKDKSNVTFENINFRSSKNFISAAILAEGSSGTSNLTVEGCNFENLSSSLSGGYFFPVVIQNVASGGAMETSGSCGGLLFVNNYLRKMGNEYGCIQVGLVSSSPIDVESIIVSNNFFKGSSPVIGTSAFNYHIVQFNDKYDSSTMITTGNISGLSVAGNVYES